MTTTATAMEILKPVVVAPGEDRAPFLIVLGTHRLAMKVAGKDTGGNFAIGILTAEPMSGPPLHMHTREDEWFYILKGEMTFQVGEEQFTAKAGTSVFAPRNIPHTWQNLTTNTVEAIGMVTPARFEGFLMEMARLRPTDPAEIQRLCDEYGNVILGPPIARRS
ncbi:MAG: cupin domain-containing protein [Ignavibacteriota bacterium]